MPLVLLLLLLLRAPRLLSRVLHARGKATRERVELRVELLLLNVRHQLRKTDVLGVNHPWVVLVLTEPAAHKVADVYVRGLQLAAALALRQLFWIGLAHTEHLVHFEAKEVLGLRLLRSCERSV